MEIKNKLLIYLTKVFYWEIQGIRQCRNCQLAYKECKAKNRCEIVLPGDGKFSSGR
jgi:hypothetical protein